jgi:hypothetical protein
MNSKKSKKKEDPNYCTVNWHSVTFASAPANAEKKPKRFGRLIKSHCEEQR